MLDAMLSCKVSCGMEMLGINTSPRRATGSLLLMRMYPGTQRNAGGAGLASFWDHGPLEGVRNFQVEVLFYHRTVSTFLGWQEICFEDL